MTRSLYGLSWSMKRCCRDEQPARVQGDRAVLWLPCWMRWARLSLRAEGRVSGGAVICALGWYFVPRMTEGLHLA